MLHNLSARDVSRHSGRDMLSDPVTGGSRTKAAVISSSCRREHAAGGVGGQIFEANCNSNGTNKKVVKIWSQI